MPGRLSLERGEYYANPRNAFWKIIASGIPDLPADYRGRSIALIDHRIALWDVLAAATRPGSLDADIGDDAIPNNFRAFLRIHADIRLIACSGACRLFILEDAIVAKREPTHKPGWSRAIAGLMASSRFLKTQTALARKSGVAQSTIGRILRGEVNPQSESLERFAMSFGLSYSTLAAIAESDDLESSSTQSLPPGRTPRLVPLLSLAQAAKSAEAVFPNYVREATDWIECPPKRHGSRTFALRIFGESMEPDYQHGDVIYVDVVVRLVDRIEAAFRRLVIESDLLYLKALDPNWPDKFVPIAADARIVGVVVGKYSDR